ncbi:MAG TPA: phosphoribosylaminoimidazolesuccinocarboxamide synthase [Candidatus Baltobacteraceae bacterium]|nr:phosphoribosylaminoimidazolesuccinocarboxamide synthase [Candidatus Baltobacteraceae bacterium]
MGTALFETQLPGLPLKGRGKVRDIYDLGDALLIVASDRISAFDVIMNDPIPDKGKILTHISNFWFAQIKDIAPTHLLATEVADFPVACRPYADQLKDRSMLVRKAQVIPFECVVRGYLSGSGWKEYQKSGSVCGIRLPAGLVESDRLGEPIFTPATKETVGTHDENVSFERMVRDLGSDLADRLRALSLAVYTRARQIAETKGIVLADTKFEFGLAGDTLMLVDEVLTPDSSRFWPKDAYRPGGPQPSFDKQFLRDYLLSIKWPQTPPPPPLPAEIVAKTRAKYLEAYERLLGHAAPFA